MLYKLNTPVMIKLTSAKYAGRCGFFRGTSEDGLTAYVDIPLLMEVVEIPIWSIKPIHSPTRSLLLDTAASVFTKIGQLLRLTA